MRYLIFRSRLFCVFLAPAPFPFLKSRLSTKQALLLLGCLGVTRGLIAQPAALPEASELDWVSYDNLSEEQKKQLPTACCGLYIEPPLPAASDPNQVQIDGIEANGNAEGEREITGNLQIQQGNMYLSAEHGTYVEQTQTATLFNNVQVRQPGLFLIGDSATIQHQQGIATINNASYVMHDIFARGKAETITFNNAEDIVIISNGVYSRCEPGDNAWLVQGSTIELNQQTGMGTARNVTLRVKNFPVLYLPWISFPINDQRVSGFLAPLFGSSRDGGIDISAPYYLNLAPNYDATLTPRIQTERGVMLGVETRYLGESWQQKLSFNFLPDDQLYNSATAGLPLSLSPPQSERWALDYDFAANIGHGWSAGINYRSISDNRYFQDLSNNGLGVTTQSYLYRIASLNYRSRHWAFSASTQDIKLIDPNVSFLNEPYRTLPRLSLDGFFSLPGGLEYGLSSEYTMFDRNVDNAQYSSADIANGVLVTGSRVALTPQLSWPLGNAYSFFTPTVKYKYATWALENQAFGTSDSPSRGIASANIDSGLIFERELKLNDSAFRQTLEPRLYYVYNQYKDQSKIPLFDTSELTFSFNQLFRDDRFSGKDRVGDANQLTLALSSRIFDQAGREQARISVGQIQHFSDRRVTLLGLPGLPEHRSSSALTSEFFYQLAADWRFGAYAEWDQHEHNVDVGNVQLQYQSDTSKVLNLAYRYRDMPAPIFVNGFDRRIKQTDIAGQWPVANNWSAVARWNYDYSNRRTLEGIAGVEYSNCCWNIRVIARQWIDNDALFFGVEHNNRGVFIQFELKGLGSILGGNVSSILNNGIRGFQDRNNGRF